MGSAHTEPAGRSAGQSATRDFAFHPLFHRRVPLQQSGETLGDFAYRILRDALRSGKFRPREHLREAEVAAWLKISRTPVREAFHRMISEGLLVNALERRDGRELGERQLCNFTPSARL
jgi:hypothetical protein